MSSTSKSKTTKPETPNVGTVAPALTPRLLTIPQAAAYCSAAVWAIRQAIINKELRACIIGRRFLIEITSLDSFIDAKFKERAA
jgi:excisionase family DNA binding protein